jgi:hypothetical protein
MRELVRQQVAEADVLVPCGEVVSILAVLAGAVVLQAVAGQLAGDREQEILVVEIP